MTNSDERRAPGLIAWAEVIVWVTAALVCLVPFAANTSALNAVMLNVPGEQGNWWHLLIGFPFFLSFAVIWLRIRALSAKTPLQAEIRILWVAIVLSMLGTMSVEVPFLMLRAGTSPGQRAEVIGLGLGTIILSGILLFLRRTMLSSLEKCLAGLQTAYLANALLCVVVYSSAKEAPPQLGWYITSVLVWPIALEIAWRYVRSYSRGVHGALVSSESAQANR
jgi:hypothetical protein